MKNAVPINASYFAVNAVLNIYRAKQDNTSTGMAFNALMKLFSNKKLPAAKRKELLGYGQDMSVEKFDEFCQNLSSKTFNFDDDVDFEPIAVCDTTPILLKTVFLLSHAAKKNVNETVIGATLREITKHIRPIRVSKKMLSQLNQYENNEIDTWENGIVEHATPMKILRKIIFKTETLEELKSALETHLVVVYVTKEEDASIPKNFNSELPENGTWQERYHLSGIEIHEEEVRFPTELVPSKTGIPYPDRWKGETEIPHNIKLNFIE
jgi:hypothetical protein